MRVCNDLRKGIETTDPRHLEVQQDHVDPVVAQHLECALGSGGDGHDLELGSAFDHALQRGARHERVVDDQQANGWLRPPTHAAVRCRCSDHRPSGDADELQLHMEGGVVSNDEPKLLKPIYTQYNVGSAYR